MFDAQAMLAELRVWVEHETPTSDPAAVNRLSRHIEGQFEALGAACRRIAGQDGYGDHLLVESPWGSEAGAVVILCHIDTVHPVGTLLENPFRVDGDKAYGPGIYDMKGGAYLACVGYRELAKQALGNQRKLKLLYTADEEVGSPTSRALIEDLATGAHAVLVVEPAREGGKVVVARRGVARYVARFRGRPAHSGSKHQDGRSAIKEMARQILDWEAMTDYRRNLSVNVGIVEGGTAFNVVPEEARAFVDIRVPNPEVAAEAIRRFEASQAYDVDVTLTLEGGLNRPAMAPNAATDALFQRAAPIARRHGFTLEGMATGGGSDGNFTYDKAPTLDGLGIDGDGAHTKWEHIRISSLVERAGFLHDLTRDLLAD
ncbi:MAG: M20 family peptidase [Geminicoccaceae bacterium]|nr:MAG: M20 family peptidase [Geminicoccaceae bacterium]